MLKWPEIVPCESQADACKRVHAWVMAMFVYVPDWEQYGIPEHFPSPADIEANFAAHGEFRDDCDGFAAACRHALRRLGIASRLVFCFTETNGRHAVCECEGWVLDNRQMTVAKTQDLERIGYRWEKMSGYADGDPWTWITG